jgi:hypothetical protein
MCIYCGTTNYRKIYEQHNGPIPKEKNGRSYQIHHIDGNHSNNDPLNLKCVTIQEHYDIHYVQKDWGACLLISGTLLISPKEKSNLARKFQLQRVEAGTHHWLGPKSNNKRVSDGTHHFLGGELQRINNNKLVKEGKHPWLSGETQRKTQLKKVEEGTHNFSGGDISRKNALKRVSNGTHHFLGDGQFQRSVQQKHIANGTHHFLDKEAASLRNKKLLAEGKHHSQVKWNCPHCNREGLGKSNYTRYHGDRCKAKPNG